MYARETHGDNRVEILIPCFEFKLRDIEIAQNSPNLGVTVRKILLFSIIIIFKLIIDASCRLDYVLRSN